MKDFSCHWKKLARENKLRAHHVVQRAILIAMSTDSVISRRDIVYDILIKAFPPVIRSVERKNGRYPWDTINHCREHTNPFVVLYDLDFDCTILKDSRAQLLLDVPASEILENDLERETFYNIMRSLDPKSIDRTYCYIVVDADMLPIQKAVQAAHVAMVAGQAYAYQLTPSSTYFVILQTSHLQRFIDEVDIDHVTFYEPDYSIPRITSMASRPIRWDEFSVREKFADLDLMKVDDDWS